MDTFRLLGCVSLFAVTAVVATDRGWFGAPGELWANRAEAERLDAYRRQVAERHQFNNALLDELVEGRVTFRHAVGVFVEVNRTDPGYVSWLRCNYPTGRFEKSAARNVLARIATDLREDPERQSAVLCRLDADYADWFGESPPPR